MAAASRPKRGEVETRTAPDLLATEDRKIRSRIPYGIESRDLGGFVEIIEPGALADTELDDLVVTVDHGGLPLGRYPGTLDAAAAVELRDHPDATQKAEGKMEQDQKQDDVVVDESRTAPPAGSLRVEERAEAPAFRSLAQAFESRGFPGSAASVTWDEFRTLTWSGGTVLDTLNPVRQAGVALGYDQRWAYPAFPSTGVDSCVTAVQVLRQQSRTLPAGTAVVRPLDSATTKPEVATVTELVSQQLSQVAAVSSNVPNIHGEQIAFQSMVEVDLRLSISEGYDRLVLNGLAQGGHDHGRHRGHHHVKASGTAGVDSLAFGRLYASPLQLQRFEVDAGLTNRSNYRLEGHATFGVERLTAAARII
jgi:hypothetical protein